MFDNITSRRQERKAARILNERPLRVANEELRILISTVQDLVDRLETLGRAKAAIGEGGAQLGEQARQLAVQGQQYVRRRPFTSVGVVAPGMLAIGLVTGRARTTH